MHFLRLLLLLVLFFLADRPALAGETTIDGPVVTGRVTVSGTGAALENARITLLHPDSRDTLAASVYTDASGYYTFQDVSTGAEDPGIPDADYAAFAAYPNPVDPSSGGVTIQYAAPASVTRPPAVEWFDLFGRQVNPTNALAAGTYFYRLRFDGQARSETHKLVVLGGSLDVKLERVTAAGQPVFAAGKQPAALQMTGTVLFVVERDGYVSVEDVRAVPPGSASTHDFALTSYNLQLTRTERAAAVEAVRTYWRSLVGQDVDAQNQALAAYLAAQPAFQDAGVSADQTVWARFADGLPFVIVNNRPVDSTDVAETIAPPAAYPLRTAANGGMPEGDQAYVMDIEDTGQGSPNRVATMLTHAGYTVAGGVRTGTVDDFRRLKGAAVVHISSHGATTRNWAGEEVYVIGTASFIRQIDYNQCSRASCNDRDWEEFYSGHLALGLYPEDTTQSNARGHWAITDKFVERYWSFTPESLLFLDACTSASNDAHVVKFQAALTKVGVRHLVGWSRPVGAGFAAKASSYFFDRVLGANSYQPESPPQRPFGYTEVWGHMVATGRATSGGARLVYKRPSFDEGILMPSIERVWLFELNKEIELTGDFGEDPRPDGKVFFGGTALPIKSWDAELGQIIAELQPGMKGDVVVQVRHHKSNVVPITEWKETFRFTEDLSATYDLPANTLQFKVTCSVPFHADVHPARDAPGEDPQGTFAMFYAGLDLTCTWTSSGSGTNPAGYTFSLSGSGTVAWDSDIQKQFAFSGMIDVDGILGQGKGIQMTYAVPEVTDSLSVTTPLLPGECGGPPESVSYKEAIGLSVGGTVRLELENGYDIKAGSMQTAGKQAAVNAAASMRCGLPTEAPETQPNGSATTIDVEWDGASATNAPKPTTTS